MKHNLLIELLLEELPPKALKKLGEAFASGLQASLQSQGLVDAGAQATAYATPRRLALHLSGVAERAPDRAQQTKLMPVSVGLSADGQATPALLKKLASVGADASVVPQLKRQPDGKAEALFLDSVLPGVALAEGLQKALDETLARLPIPKLMTYQLADGWSDVKFVRPAHRLLALHGAEVVPLQALGLASGRCTEGHRFEAKARVLEIAHADHYAERLQSDGAVIPGFEQRRAEVLRQLEAAADAAGLRPVQDEALLDEVTALVERPNVLSCQFEAEFLAVPPECLILTMKANQKYFPLLDAQGQLTNRFLVVSNIRPADPSAVIGGNERVVRPRLSDAKFFFDQDRKKTLQSRLDGLAKVVYHNKLGTQAERSQRVSRLAEAIGQRVGGAALAASAASAAQLAKADLLTDMVGEFPELQGVMGAYYARHDGHPAELAEAIEDHYKPRFAGDELPRNPTGVVVALADKLETLVGMFGIGNLPSGDKDPFALRRHALGVVRMLVEGGLALDPQALTRLALGVFAPGLLKDPCAELDAFMLERLKGYLREGGSSSAEVDAAIHAAELGQWRSLPARLAAVRAFAALPEAPALAAANKRIGNILKKSELPDGALVVDSGLLHEPAEQALYAAMQANVPPADALFEAGDYTASLQALAVLRAPVDAFFDGVMVNADEPALKANRLGLLRQLHRSMNRVADLSRLAT